VRRRSGTARALHLPSQLATPEPFYRARDPHHRRLSHDDHRRAPGDPERGPRTRRHGDQHDGELITDSVAQPRLQTILLGAFGVLALVLACIGIYGVLGYAVSQRMREMGVRLALGATPGAILREVLRRGLGLVALGLFIGLSGALALTRYLEALLYSVRLTDPTVFTLAIATLLVVATAACYLPARRAADVNPMAVLRED